MNKLIDAFLELPTWEGAALIGLAVTIGMALCLIFAVILNPSTSQPLPRR